MIIKYCDQYTAESTDFTDNIAMISITDPNMPDALFKSNCENLLRLKFDDLCPEELISIGRNDLMRTSQLFTMNHAKEILKFVNSLPDNIDTIHVHCKAGKSRSVAVAKFLGEKFSSYVDLTWKNPNPHVYKILKVIDSQN